MTDQEIARMIVKIKSVHPDWGRSRLAKELGCTEYRVRKSLESLNNTINKAEKSVSSEFWKDSGVVTVRSLDVKTVEDALKIAKVDLEEWEIDRHVVNSWEITIGGKNSGTGKAETYTNFQVKIWLKRKTPQTRAIEKLLEEIKANSFKVPKIKRPQCYKPGADLDWSPEQAEQLFINMVEELLERAKPFGPFERIIFPFGNDFFHTDYVYNTTTTGTPQPEADAWKNTLLRGERLIISTIERLTKISDVKVIVVPGNHARHTEISIGRILNAYFHNNENVEVDCSLSPYKFHHFGVNLIGFEHGHSIKQQVRLAALMANECRLNGWSEARYCEWHLGDQHRKGSSRPSMLEEQGVSVEFLPGLTAPNEWHRIHSFNWQKRAGMAFVWDYSAGPIARLQVNIDSYTGELML